MIDYHRLIKQRQIGEFEVPDNLFQRAPGAIVKITEGMIITRCEYVFAYKSLVYQAFCEYFEPVPIGSLVPRYDPILTQLGPNRYHVDWKKV